LQSVFPFSPDTRTQHFLCFALRVDYCVIHRQLLSCNRRASIRTCGRRKRKPMLYPAELRARATIGLRFGNQCVPAPVPLILSFRAVSGRKKRIRQTLQDRLPNPTQSLRISPARVLARITLEGTLTLNLHYPYRY